MPKIDIFADPDDANLAALIHVAREELSELERLAPAAVERQWLAPPRPAPREDTAERSKGLRNDPTATIALDDRRLAVRQGLVNSHRSLKAAIFTMREYRHKLVTALDNWNGDNDE